MGFLLHITSDHSIWGVFSRMRNGKGSSGHVTSCPQPPSRLRRAGSHSRGAGAYGQLSEVGVKVDHLGPVGTSGGPEVYVIKHVADGTNWGEEAIFGHHPIAELEGARIHEWFLRRVACSESWRFLNTPNRSGHLLNR
jgi:hypothetical protein